MELRKIVKSTSFLVISKTVQFLVGIVRSKIAAVTIGTTGVGLFSQVSYMVNMISQTTLMSMNDGLVKLIAERKSKEGFPEILKRLMKSYSVLILFSSLLIIILCLIFAGSLTKFFFGDEKYIVYFLIGLSCLPITISNSLSFALLKSYKATKQISRSNITSSIITVIVFIPLIFLFKTTGAVISVAVNYIVLLFINNYQARKVILQTVGINFRQIFSTRPDPVARNEILRFAFFGLTSGAALIISESICRSIVINSLGIDRLGVYSPITSWGSLFTGFILPSINIYLFPRYSESKSNEEIIALYNDYNRLISFILIPVLFVAISFQHILIPIFYSADFLEAEKYLPWHFIGQAFYLWWYPMALILTPIGKIKTYSLLIITMAITNILIVYFLTPLLGLSGWMFKFILSPIIFLFIFFIYLRKIIGLKIYLINIVLMIYVIFASLILTLLHPLILKFCCSFLLSILGLIFLKKEEWKFLLSKIKM